MKNPSLIESFLFQSLISKNLEQERRLRGITLGANQIMHIGDLTETEMISGETTL